MTASASETWTLTITRIPHDVTAKVVSEILKNGLPPRSNARHIVSTINNWGPYTLPSLPMADAQRLLEQLRAIGVCVRVRKPRPKKGSLAESEAQRLGETLGQEVTRLRKQFYFRDLTPIEDAKTLKLAARTLATVVLSGKPVLRDTLSEKCVDWLGKLQCVDWGREESGMQTIPSTVVPTWKGAALTYREIGRLLISARKVES